MTSQCELCFALRLWVYTWRERLLGFTSQCLYIFLFSLFPIYIILHIFTQSQWLGVNIPPLIWRDVGESKHCFESFNLFSSKHFGEDVCDLLISGTMAEMDRFGLNMMSNQMIFSIDVLRSIMELWVLCQFCCRGIVNHEWSRLYLLYLQIFTFYL